MEEGVVQELLVDLGGMVIRSEKSVEKLEELVLEGRVG